MGRGSQNSGGKETYHTRTSDSVKVSLVVKCSVIQWTNQNMIGVRDESKNHQSVWYGAEKVGGRKDQA